MDEEAVQAFVDQAQSTLEASPQMDEEATKFRLVSPFIELLGWDPRSTEVEPEYTVRMATGTTKVDFALQLGDTPVVFIEVKPARSELDEDNVAQLRSYMRQELDVDWGVVTNGRSFEVLTKEREGRGEEISLIQFDLNDLHDQPELLEILSKEHIRSGKADEIATQIAQTGEAIVELDENREEIASQLGAVLTDVIGESVPIDPDAQAAEFIDDVIATLEEQQSAIGSTSPVDEDRVDVSESPDQQTKEYIITLQKDGTTLATFADEVQSDVMAAAVNYLIENHDLMSSIQPLPYVPGREKAIINDTPSSPHDEEAMRAYRELTDGYYLDTHMGRSNKKRHLRRLVDKCDLNINFSGQW